jgi:SAM-dependent methyltransferase
MSLPDSCPLCGKEAGKQEVVTSHVYGAPKGKHRAFFHCSDCDVRYQYPRLTIEEEEHFYVAEFESFMASRAGSKGGWHQADEHIAANEETRLRRMKYIEPLLKDNSSVLEVGCSTGFMLWPLKKSGHQCTGIEPSGVFGDYVRGRGINVYDSIDQLQDSEPDSKFDLVLHFFVLEHISDPVPFLKAQLDLLNPGGKIVFEIPNAADPLYSVYDIPAFERFYWSVAHPWYFSEPSVNYLMSQLGQSYEILRDQRYDLSNHMVWARDGKPGGMERFTEQLGVELEEGYKNALIKSGKCDTLIGIITKY